MAAQAVVKTTVDSSAARPEKRPKLLKESLYFDIGTPIPNTLLKSRGSYPSRCPDTLTGGANRLTIHASLWDWVLAFPSMGQPASPPIAFTVSADLIRGLIDCAVQCGVPRDRLADMIDDGSGAERKSPVPVRYSGEHTLRLWDRLLRLTGDPIIGF